MEDDVREALEELRESVAELGRARTPQRRQQAQRQVAEEREDLEEVLRANGYRLSRKDLDELIEEREFERFRARYERMQAESKGDGDGDGKGDGDGDGKGDGDGDGKGKGKGKPAGQGSGSGSSGDDTGEWT